MVTEGYVKNNSLTLRKHICTTSGRNINDPFANSFISTDLRKLKLGMYTCMCFKTSIHLFVSQLSFKRSQSSRY